MLYGNEDMRYEKATDEVRHTCRYDFITKTEVETES
jgi:hypothetical protein